VCDRKKIAMPDSTPPEVPSDGIHAHDRADSRTDKLVARNAFDDVRQDESDARQDRAEKKAHDRKVVVDERAHKQDVTLHDVLYILEGRMGHIELSMTDLAQASNHRMQAFESLVASMDEKWSKAIGLKADKDDLLTSWGERLLRIPLARWILGVIGLALITTAATQHWFIHAATWFEGFFH
jgi:hypothetical protein